jgi:acyl-CoA reductase-like NAD-dependent aldehyde dehydrogenase
VQLVQALAAGNAVLLKPAPGSTAPAQVLIELLVQAGIDPDLIALLPDSVEAAQSALAAEVDKVVFTGSAATGEKILAQLAPKLTLATMELSGCDAVFVRADADLDLVVKSLRFGLELNAGASCIGPRRVFVHRSLATELEGRLAQALGSSRRKEAQTLGHADQNLLTSASPKKSRQLLDEALSRGAHVVAGALHPDGSITLPIILAAVPPDATLLREDVFAPVLSLITVGNDEEALALNDACPYALGASIFSRAETTAHSLATRIHAGGVVINDMIAPTADPRLPFGGRGRSGFGVTRGAEGLLEMTTTKVITWNRARWRPHLDEASMGDAGLFQAFLEFTYGPWRGRWSALRRLIQTGRQRMKSPKSKP